MGTLGELFSMRCKTCGKSVSFHNFHIPTKQCKNCFHKTNNKLYKFFNWLKAKFSFF